MTVIDWLLDSDPSIRWQVMRDLLDEPAEVVAAERARVATEGWGARLLALQGQDGQWDGGTYVPSWVREQNLDVSAWTATSHSLQLLRAFGLDPSSDEARRAVALVRDNSRWEYNDELFFTGEVEPCINGGTVALGAYFGQDVASIVDRLLGERLADGGWNCEAERGSTRSSFHTTINVLEGLLEFERATGGSPELTRARLSGQEYLLERHLLRRRSTGEVVDPAWLHFSFPTRWRYDALWALDYLRRAGAEPDDRLDEALDLVQKKQGADGRWLLETVHEGAVHFDLEAGPGQPSRWITLRALRVLDWAGRGRA